MNFFDFILHLSMLAGAFYIVRYGLSYSEDGVFGPPEHLDHFGKKVSSLLNWILSPVKSLDYFRTLYSEPLPSERVLGGFFFGKTLVTTAIAFYYLDSLTLFAILVFSACFDSLTGIYQHTLMNYFHRSLFTNRVLQLTQNLVKRFFVDIVRAEIMMLMIQGSGLVAGESQLHIFRNRLVSSSYYFNAMLIDKLVDLGVVSRNFRSHFVIVASTIGGMLCLLDFAQTPLFFGFAPLKALMYFNIGIFIAFSSLYLAALGLKKNQYLSQS